jgi:diguanylate cyclase (GGDEF)-like protein
MANDDARDGAHHDPEPLRGAALRDAQRVRDDALSLAAAELRAPASILLRQIHQLQRAPEYALAAPARRALAAVERQARRVAAVADVLVELEAIDRGEVQLRRKPVDLAALVARIAGSRQASARARGIELVGRGEGPSLTVAADPDRLERALNALVDALLALCDRGSCLRITLEARDAGALVTLELDPTRRAVHARRRGARPGVALAVARRIAELHGGSLAVDSAGGGLALRLALPSSAPAREAQRRAAGDARARLLVVDDDHDAREVLSMMLGDDYEVLLAGDGQEAFQRAAAERPDLVLMDLYMPRMDGLAALEAIRGGPETEDLPVILISARGDELTRSRSLDLGAVDFLQKPFSARELKARIERTLRLTRRESELAELARTDPLTGLANLRAFRGRLDEEVKRARRYRTPLACVMVDMDNLKPINDELGHAAGDHAIRGLAEVIRRELRETDFAGRYGGDEFVLLLPHTTGVEARVLSERIAARLRDTPLALRGRAVTLGASFGIAALGEEPLDDPGDILVRRADAALYAAKRGGRGRVAAHPSADGAPAL